MRKSRFSEDQIVHSPAGYWTRRAFAPHPVLVQI